MPENQSEGLLENTRPQELFVPIIIPEENQVVVQSDRQLLRTEIEEGVSHENSARRFAANIFNLTAVKPITPLRHEDAVGYGLYPAHDQPLQLSRVDGFLVKVRDIDEYIEHDETDSVSAALVKQARDNLRRPR